MTSKISRDNYKVNTRPSEVRRKGKERITGGFCYPFLSFIFDMLLTIRGSLGTWCSLCDSPSWDGGSFVFLDVGPSILFLVFPFCWVLWLINGGQGFINVILACNWNLHPPVYTTTDAWCVWKGKSYKYFSLYSCPKANHGGYIYLPTIHMHLIPVTRTTK